VVTLVPSAPANMGLYQSSVVYALGLLLTEKGPSEVLAEIMFVVLTLPLIVGGAIAIASAGFNLSDLHRHAHDAHSSRKLKSTNGTPQEGD
jgi:fructose-specific phosphotransferase system IIC component